MSTIAAISTPIGNGGIGIVRISGKNTFDIVSKIFKMKKETSIENIKSHSIKFGHIVNPKNSEVLDEVLVSFFRAPNTYTKEDMAEINCHGGAVVIQNILDLVLENGAQMAEPGEFTKRAFLNGRIDLSQAEAVMDVINSKTSKETKASLNQLEGHLSRYLEDIRKDLMDILVNIEANVDYPEYDIEEVSEKETLIGLNKIKNKLKRLEETFDNGRILKEGISVAIIGRPNAGKSSLLNALLKEDRAIVTEIEGTTRDTIEEFVNIKGIPLKLIDTAGIREAKDLVEKIGVEKAKQMASKADLIIVLFDVSKELTQEDEEILEFIKDKKAIILLNKMDLENNLLSQNEKILNSNKKIIEISALKLEGIEKLEDEILNMFNVGNIEIGQDIIITNSRHKSLIRRAIKNIETAEDTINQNMPIDIIAINITETLQSIGEITGNSVSDDLINSIFAKFCLGK